jgi:HlyD family secretion protein
MALGTGKKRNRKLYIIIGVVVLVVLVGAGIAIANSGGTKIDKSKIGKVDQGDLAKSVVATGKIEPITKITIKSKASGIVKRLLVDAGENVKAGQIMAELDKEEIQARVRAAQAALAAAEANLSASQADYQRSEVDAQGPEVPLLQRAYERAKKMAGEGVVSQAALDDAQRAYETAVNKRDMARANLSVSKAKIAQARAQVEQNRAALAQNEEELRNSTIVAPIDGIVLARNVEIGDAVSSILVLGSTATSIFDMGDTKEVFVRGKVDESDIGKVYLGQTARIKVESFKDKTFDGKVTKISPMGTEKDNVTTFEVRVSITNATGELKANMTANAEVILEEHKNVLYIPEGALIYDKDKKASVEVPDPKAPEGKRKVAVTVGISNGSKTELLSGLKKDQEVVLQ